MLIYRLFNTENIIASPFSILNMLRTAKAILAINLILVQFALTAQSLHKQDDPSDVFYPFENHNLPWDERVDNLVGLLTLDEKTLQMARGGTVQNGPAPPVERLGIGPYSWNSECLGGVSTAGKATSFPQPIGIGASFSVALQEQVATATSIELRAKFNDYKSQGIYGDHKGASCLSPVVNIMRHPLWGRNQETYGEDPYLSGEFGAAFVRGIHGDHPRYYRGTVGCKHFDVYGGPENIPEPSFQFDAVVSERDWRLSFQPPFHECIRAGALGVMCSFNKINGVPACANKKLLTDVLRTEWGFPGYVISDENAIENVMNFHNYTTTPVDTAAACINAGTTLNLCSANPNNFYMLIPQAIAEGKLTEDTVTNAVKSLYYTRMRLGEFDPPELNPYSISDINVLQSDLHRNLSLKAAMETFVLLKNTNNFLPLQQQTYGVVSVVGPFANSPYDLYGHYTADPDVAYTITPAAGLEPLAGELRTTQGCDTTACPNYDSVALKAAVTGSDLVFVCIGTGRYIEEEGRDRADLKLPGFQEQLLKDALEASGGAPVVLLLFTASPVEIDPATLGQVTSILEVFFPAQTAGEAIRRVVTKDGPSSVPAARLPYTWQKSMDQVPEMTNYTMHNRTYRYWYYPDPPLYPFGYGLSYTSFRYSDLDITPTSIQGGQSVFVSGRVENIGAYDADEVIQLYISWKTTTQVMPKIQLVGFQRVHVLSGSTYDFTFEITPERMEVYVDDIGLVVESGSIGVYVGGQQPNQVTTVGSNLLAGEFIIA